MKNKNWLLLIMFLSIIGTVVVYRYLPSEIPLHWDVNGEVDRVGGKISIFFTAILPIALYILFIVIPKIDPKRNSYLKHNKAYSIFKVMILLFLIGIHWVTIIFALGYEVNISLIVTISIGLLFIILGNYMPQIRPNYMFGIRTPWTLANEIVWKKTHRAGGYGFMALGIIGILSGIIKSSIGFILFFSSLFIFLIFIFLYSYLVYRKVEEK